MEETTMSSSLPPEIFDLIVEHLHDQPTALKTCCTVSKSWVSRARTHLFAHVGISPVESWTRVFPDPSNSPAHYVRSLSISIYSTTRSTDARALICSFRNVTKLRVYVNWCNNSRIFFAQLHGFSPVLKSLHLTYFSTPPSEIFDLVCSFPSLEGLSLNSLTAEDEPDGGWNIPSTSPKLTGTLVLEMEGEILPVVRRLLGLPGGLHFSSISVMCLDREAESVAGLVLGCSNTLESLRVNYRPSDTVASTAPPPLDLSKAASLKNMTLHWSTVHTVRWITRTLQTTKSENFLQITICVPSSFTNIVQATDHREWEDLDHTLFRLWTSRSVRPKFEYAKTRGCDQVKPRIRAFLPELARSGVLDVV